MQRERCGTLPENQIAFILAHELAHIYLPRGIRLRDEQDCDDEAMRRIAQLQQKPDPGAFETILKAALDQGQTNLWAGISNAADLDARFNRIRGRPLR
jgi:hypothetical protein